MITYQYATCIWPDLPYDIIRYDMIWYDIACGFPYLWLMLSYGSVNFIMVPFRARVDQGHFGFVRCGYIANWIEVETSGELGGDIIDVHGACRELASCISSLRLREIYISNCLCNSPASCMHVNNFWYIRVYSGHPPGSLWLYIELESSRKFEGVVLANDHAHRFWISRFAFPIT